MLNLEHQHLLYRLKMIMTWITLKLKEFNIYSSQVFDILDDWIVVAVEEENAEVQTAIQKLKEAITE